MEDARSQESRASGGSSSAHGASLLPQRVWSGRLPVVFSLAPAEVTTLHAPRPFYAMIPRMSYLVAQTRDVVEYFRDAAPPMSVFQGAQIWFEAAGGIPLKWHLPFGLLRDLLCPLDAELPWALTVHFQGYPGAEAGLLPCENEQSVESHFMHSLKQATFLRTGSTKAIMGLPEAQQTQIWTSIKSNDFEAYREATRELQLDGGVDVSMLRHLPVRVHLDDTPAIQMPIAPLQEGREKTLLEVLRYLLPDLFPFMGAETSVQDDKMEVVVHGIPVPLAVSIVELYRHFAYADGFLYVAVLSRRR